MSIILSPRRFDSRLQSRPRFVNPTSTNKRVALMKISRHIIGIHAQGAVKSTKRRDEIPFFDVLHG